MIDRETAYQLVLATLSHLSLKMAEQGDSVIIIESSTIEKDYGWIFFYNSKKFIETKNSRHFLVGNGPIVVEKADGSVHKLGTAGSGKYQIELYEARRDKENNG